MKFIFRFCAAISVMMLWSTTGHAQWIEVQEMNQGACWVREVDGNFKVASFNDREAFSIHPWLLQLNLFDKLIARLKDLGLTSYPEATVHVSLFCGGGHRLTIKVDNSERPLCIHADGNLTEFTIFSNSKTPTGGAFCLGNAPKELMVGYESETDAAALTTALQGEAYSDMIESLRNHPDSKFILIKAKDAYLFREELMKSRIAADATLKQHIQYIEYNGIAVNVGEVKNLFDDKYPGY
jgi:hypothetical protein